MTQPGLRLQIARRLESLKCGDVWGSSHGHEREPQATQNSADVLNLNSTYSSSCEADMRSRVDTERFLTGAGSRHSSSIITSNCQILLTRRQLTGPLQHSTVRDNHLLKPYNALADLLSKCPAHESLA